MELEGPRAKLDWAVEKLEALDVAQKAWSETQPLRVADEFDDKSGCHILRIRRHEPEPTERFRMGLMVGDVIHNARSSLEQAAWLMACRSNPVEKLWEPAIARKISFPITDAPGKFRGHNVLRFLAEDAIAVLEPLQPYKGGHLAECLGHLDGLWNIDKHRVIHSLNVNLGTSTFRYRFRAVFPERDLFEHPPEVTLIDVPSPIEDGAEVARVRFYRGIGPPLAKVEVTGQPTCEIAFGSGEFCFTMLALSGLLYATAQALSAVEGLPDDPP